MNHTIAREAPCPVLTVRGETAGVVTSECGFCERDLAATVAGGRN